MIKINEIPYGTDEWYRYRSSGIGGSEASILFGFQDKYSSPAKLYNLKIGRIDLDRFDNEAMAWGRWLESTILNRWQFYDGENSYIDNFNSNKVIRKYSILDGFAVNTDYPWLFYSEDGHFEDGFKLSTGEYLKKGLLECKTITTQTASRWEFGIPPGYLYQVHQGMLIHELEYAEIVVLKDGRYLTVYPIERNDNICEQIVRESKDFWYNRVVPGKEAYERYLLHDKHNKMDLAADALYEVDRLEPEPDGSEGQKEFENKRWKETTDRTTGDKKNWNRLELDKKLLEVEKSISKLREQNIQLVRRDLRMNNVDAFEYEKQGYVRIYQRKGANNPMVDNRVKVKVDEVAVEKAVKQLMKVINESDR